MNDLQSVRDFVSRREPSSVSLFDDAVIRATEVVLIGSRAAGLGGAQSDLDILFVGDGIRYKSTYLDLIWIKPEKLNSRTWLGSELATHVAQYGVWLKGVGCWRGGVFFSDLALRHKCERILVRLAKVYAKRHSLSDESITSLAADSFLDMTRAVFLSQKEAVPPTAMVIDRFLEQPNMVLDAVCSDRLLGPLGRFFVEHFYRSDAILAAVASIRERRLFVSDQNNV